MKTFGRMMGVTVLAVLALQACSSNPSVSAGGTIEEFARSLNGKRYEFDLTGKVWRPERSAELVTAQRIPKGLTIALAPAQEHCKRGGGAPSFAELLAAEQQAQLPQRILSARDGTPIWALDIQYFNVQTTSGVDPSLRTPWRELGMTLLRTQLLSPDQYAARLKDEQAEAQAREKAATSQLERQAALEQGRQQRIKEQEIEARRIAAQWPAKVAAFQANLKVGDRFKWGRAPIWGGPFVGMVVRVEGALALVQFDNLTFPGQQTRYLSKAELEPFDGPTPTDTGTIN